MINSRDIDDLHPCVWRGAAELIARMAAGGYTAVGISSTLRDHEYQAKLYAQGRTAPGAVVTSAKPGYSTHNYGLAFDIFQNIRGREWNDSGFFALAGKLGQEMGFVWGGSFRNLVDKPHFEYTAGLRITDLLAGRRLPADARMPWEELGKEVESMTQETFARMLAAAQPLYNTPDDVPEWGKCTVAKLVGTGLLKGDGTGLGLTEDMLRVLVINDRAGLYK
jgi:peptidoglycan L-alanyl-D-glutamate endopeptidase CwlK